LTTQQTIVAAALIALGLAGASPAQAQPYYYGAGEIGPRSYDQGLPPYEVMRVVRSTGLVPLTRPMRRGSTYVVVASNRSGGQVRVVIDAATGDIVTVNPMAAMPPPYGSQPFYPNGAPSEEPGGTYGMVPRPDGPPPPVPPRDVPRAPVAAAPASPPPPGGAPRLLDQPKTAHATTGQATPALASAPVRTPLPRPRPKFAANDGASASAPTPKVAPPPPAPASLPTATAPAIINPVPRNADGTTQMVPIAPLE
jgi:hypothetical protein